MKAYKFVITACCLLFFLSLHSFVQAQNLDVTSTYPIEDKDAISGDILSSRPGSGIVRANSTYDNRIFGILQDNPVLVFRNINAKDNEKPVMRLGTVQVNITDFNGKLEQGDYITSSPIPGKGMKAQQSGYVIGTAISPVQETGDITYEGKSYKVGTIQVALRIEYGELNTARSANAALNSINAAFFKNIDDPEKFTILIRYLIAGLVALVFFFFSFLSFTRSISKGVEAIGRNPLAKRSIQISILLHLGLTVFVSAIGLIIVFLIIRV